jgi:hypothetical protein
MKSVNQTTGLVLFLHPMAMHQGTRATKHTISEFLVVGDHN